MTTTTMAKIRFTIALLAASAIAIPAFALTQTPRPGLRCLRYALDIRGVVAPVIAHARLFRRDRVESLHESSGRRGGHRNRRLCRRRRDRRGGSGCRSALVRWANAQSDCALRPA